MNKEYLITDSEDTSFERDEIKKKISKLSNYLHKVENRISQLDKQLSETHEEGIDKTLLKKGLDLYDLSEKISKEI